MEQEETNEKQIDTIEQVDKNIVKKKKWLTLIKNILLFTLFNIVFPYIIYLVSNICNQEFWGLREIRRTTPIYNFSFIYELVIIYASYFLFRAIFKKSLFSNIAIAILFNIISIISFYKINVVGKPFLPEDILLIGDALEIASYGNLKIEKIIILQLIITIILLIVQWLIIQLSKYKENTRKIARGIMAVIAVAILCWACCFNWTDRVGFDENSYRVEDNYYIYGATVEFYRNMYKLVQKPQLDIYSADKLKKIENEMNNLSESNKEDRKNPNIIVIMAESFTDITQEEGIAFSKDPLPTYRSLIQEYAHGNIVSSIYGGETSMSEFEFLTGSSTNFIYDEKYPYAQIIKNNTASVVRALNEEGYDTTAIHANGGQFYNRDKAYEYLGFDKAIFIDDMEDLEDHYRDCVQDIDTAEEIVKQYENMTSDKKFIFAITMESHMPYAADKYENKEITLETDLVEGEELINLEAYVQGLYNFDKSIKYLIDYFEDQEEEVILVFYGDHRPAFKTLFEDKYGESIQKYQTPYVTWSNYEAEFESPELISIAGLSMEILNKANINLPWYYDYISYFYKEYPVCTKRFLIDKYGEQLDVNTRNEIIDNYNIIQYDLLYQKEVIK